jgi:Zn-dependent protease
VKLGDDTPIEQGRMTLNPFVHMGPVSLIVLLISGIAWGLMPIDRRRLRGKYGEAQVAAAGPFMNVVIAAVVLTALGLWQRYRDVPTSELSQMAQNGEYLLWVFGMMNVCLALFNLVPCPPLDGAHILANFSDSFARTLDGMMQTGMYFRFAIILFAVGGYVIFPFGTKLAGAYLFWVRGDTRSVWSL